jgi:abortive infection bacteriophage resistance protein
MANKKPFSIADQIALLKERGMLFKDEQSAIHFLKNISYYRLKGYWWGLQVDYTLHTFKPNTYFEDVIECYNFDRQLRLVLFDAIERIEIALRTKMIHHLSLSYGSLWYLNSNLFEDNKSSSNPKITTHENTVNELKKEFDRSQEIFIKDQKARYPNQHADAWKILEVASLGSLSKLYKNLEHQLPEKATISKEMGLNLHKELASWLEAITYLRNIIAHHSRLWGRSMVKMPVKKINNPQVNWLDYSLKIEQNKPFLIISSMIFLCNNVTPNHSIKKKIIDLIDLHSHLPISQLGFFDNWKEHPIWK